MINYSIDVLRGREVRITYSKEGHSSYTIYAAFGTDTPSEEDVTSLVQEHSFQIAHLWETGEITDVTLPNTSGALKTPIFSDKPEYNESNQRLEAATTETDTTITYGYNVVDLTDSEKGALIRNKRDALLRNSDTFALSDRPMSAALTNYRQSLRDITDQDTFPGSVVWPTLPVD